MNCRGRRAALTIGDHVDDRCLADEAGPRDEMEPAVRADRHRALRGAGGDHAHVVTVGIAVVVEHIDFDGAILTSRDKVLGMHFTTDAESTEWFDPAMKAVQETVDKLLVMGRGEPMVFGPAPEVMAKLRFMGRKA